MKFLRLISVLVFIFSIFSCQSDQNQNKDITIGFEFKKDTLLRFIQDEDTLDTAFEIELAESDYEKETGLMHRKEMKDNQGMLFIYTSEATRPSFYMKNTFLPLDLIYFDKNMKIVDFNLNTMPLSEELISSEIPSLFVLEVKAGVVEKFDLKKGDQIILN
ncbi:DUF192 domain-containing protein [Psychroflexus montanilacus]|uniref:DUF192 domain-containing protein n=1 Tax=Psychroflexus montanilacus TaxID=2873598 RepID=UPI001CCF34CC|nr:DUF192 domain-containing protein [Psychroflexus montanilacus]MBZ9651317.1 DUF192 domain-containing protein [Psychroflexus montanilacus]